MGKIWLFLRHSRWGEIFRSLISNRLVNLFWHLPLAVLAVVFFRYPSRELKIIGVTGTDGKTTTASLIYQFLIKAGKKAALISTVSIKIGKKEIPTGPHVTSPHPWKLQGFLRRMADKKYEYVVLEVTSHGLDQYRVFGVDFLMGVITNVTREHLDYHKSYEEYLAAKAKLLDRAKIAILNRDDESYQYLVSKLKTPARCPDLRSWTPRRWREETKIVTYGIKKKADFSPKSFKFKTSLPGEYNRYNCLAAIAAASSLGLPEKKIREAAASFKGVVGRMEEIDEGQGFRVVVDFAHTPNALENTLKTLRSWRHATRNTRHERIIVVFGCAGLRDKEKRPVMGEIAAKYADLIVLTAEDPRTEDVNEIINQITEGCLEVGAKEADFHSNDTYHWSKEARFFRIPDRRKAIKFVIQKLARKGDIVVICGKGHEQSMCFGKTEYSWSDQQEAKRALRKKTT